MGNKNTDDNTLSQAVAEGGAYEIIQQRLVQHGEALEAQARALNNARTEQFGSTDMAIASRVRVRTENNCIGRDIVQVGDLLVFGFNVFIGLKTTTTVEDVFALYQLVRTGDECDMRSVPIEGSFLAGNKFRHDFDELYKFYKDTRLVQLVHKDGKLLASFQIGERLEDVRVFRWSVSSDGNELAYIDNRGERDIEMPTPFDFAWTEATRENIVQGRFPHVNVLDTVFVETTRGELTIKIENNTEAGEGIYAEPVEELNQSLNDSEILYARIGNLILLKILPYKEEQYRHFVFNKFNGTVQRIDAVGESCVQLPEDHGIIFPGGYYLQTGETRSFGEDSKGLRYKRQLKSPNGEDVLYVFYEPDEGIVALLSYNLITKSLQNPIMGHGYALAENGTVIVFNAEHEARRIHSMQIWDTPYASAEYASTAPVDDSFFSRIGNAELVRGVSDLYSVIQLIRDSEASQRHYEELRRSSARLFDDHFWLDQAEALGIGDIVREIGKAVEQVIDEFEKVEAIRHQSDQALRDAERTQRQIEIAAEAGVQKSVTEFVETLDQIRRQRGHLATIREYRYIDTARIDAMDETLVSFGDDVGARTAEFLSSDGALQPYRDSIETLAESISSRVTVATLDPDIEALDDVANGLDLLSDLIATLKVADATVQTEIVDAISAVYASLNQSRALARQRRESLGSEESVAQFGAQFKLFSQSVENALGMATTPERCDDQLARLLVQLEELEGQFSESETFLTDIMQKREEVYETFEAHKQRQLDRRQKRAQTVADAINRMLANVERRTSRAKDIDELNTYLASDALVLKIRDLVEQLRELDSPVKADDAEARMKMLRDQAIRALRDKTQLYSEDGRTIKLGPRHAFSVNTERLDLTLIPRDGELSLHLIGTQFFESVSDPILDVTRQFWDLNYESESPDVYRGEYLAYQVMREARAEEDALSWEALVSDMHDMTHLQQICREFATKKYKDGYEKGVHDVDAAALLGAVLPKLEQGDLLQFSPPARALAQIYWHHQQTLGQQSSAGLVGSLVQRAGAVEAVQVALQDRMSTQILVDEVAGYLADFTDTYAFDLPAGTVAQSARYLVAELSRDHIKFVRSAPARTLVTTFKKTMSANVWQQLNEAIAALATVPGKQYRLATSWLAAFQDDEMSAHYVPEAVAELITGTRLERRAVKVDPQITVTGLFGEHANISGGTLETSLDTFLSRLAHHLDVVVPGYRQYLQRRREFLDEARDALRLDEFRPRPLSSFVRNRLINESYLPIIGDNLAKQIGTTGDTKRSDLSGLLMMISPPGYGKTTLMEYVASRLGLTFVKVNGPALGHHVTSLDPATAPDATSAQELEKLNLSFEMGDNVMLYLDDIQHTSAEFLQKFISLCDSTRRVEGVWKGNTRTYDLRGRKFCVVMAGNPYTESGEVFRVPDMLANRADIYNLGDVLSGKEEQFSLSYIENALTSNAVLAPLATRDIEDVYRFIDRARGRSVASTDLTHSYSGAEINEITTVLQRLLQLQEVVLKVNQQYIESAAQEDHYRVEPPFLLQGSYRNMNKLAEKVSAVMNEAELTALVSDHYRGEAQLLSQGTEANLLKLGELNGSLSTEETARWSQIKADFVRNKKFGGGEEDVGNRIAMQLSDLVETIDGMGNPGDTLAELRQHNLQATDSLREALEALRTAVAEQQTTVNVTSEPSKEFGEVLSALNTTIEHTLFPLVRSMDKRIAQDLEAHNKLDKLGQEVELLKGQLDP
ncbi:MAG: DNA repair ATPase [Pseudomonadota bacterium]